MSKRLYRSQTDSTIAGVCGGLGEYFAIDPAFIRIVAVLLIFADGIGVLGYIIAWIVIPKRPTEVVEAENESAGKQVEYASWNKYIPGAIFILVGVFFLLRENFWWWHLDRFWPLLLIAIGIYLVVNFAHRKSTDQISQGGANESSQV